MKLEDAKKIITELKLEDNLWKHISYSEICGSIRREKPEVNDIDWVIVPVAEKCYGFEDETFNDTIKRLHQGTVDKPMLGEKIKRFFYKGINIDIYIATEKNFETLMLIRTGSKEHNVKLTTLARSKFLKLYAGGQGLCKIKGGIYNNEPEEIMEVVEDTEKGILYNLLGNVPEPKDRN